MATVDAQGGGRLAARGEYPGFNLGWQAAVSASRWNPDLESYVPRRLSAGKPWPVVMGAVARKPLARIYVGL